LTKGVSRGIHNIAFSVSPDINSSVTLPENSFPLVSKATVRGLPLNFCDKHLLKVYSFTKTT